MSFLGYVVSLQTRSCNEMGFPSFSYKIILSLISSTKKHVAVISHTAEQDDGGYSGGNGVARVAIQNERPWVGKVRTGQNSRSWASSAVSLYHRHKFPVYVPCRIVRLLETRRGELRSTIR